MDRIIYCCLVCLFQIFRVILILILINMLEMQLTCERINNKEELSKNKHFFSDHAQFDSGIVEKTRGARRK